ncbi:DUF6884 domain-containing protein [Streptomyces sp. RLB3-6]|uniref:DUF6884 domain-containing protein n=1 Tax=Streptomyces sp. RLB3-6 TaxID=2594457 RepID=UPI0011634854|nr:DUF6884 domain-containing protein [Streptomyces sp. RLB3-6]QDN84395.1 hypothetical protein FNV61_00270 [Streptomyces sp. RLB3-6]
MSDRFATPEDVRSHWRLEEGDPFRIAETKDEAASRRHNVRRRGEQASEAELVGEALIIARIHYPDANRYRWCVFHAGTAHPVLTLELEDVRPSDNGDRARELAEALDQWRDAATQEPFDWTSEGLVDRLRSPYGRGMLDHVRGTDPGDRWAGTVSADPTSWETDDGQKYRYDHDVDSVSVYDPDGLLIARGDRKFDAKTKKSATIGEMRDGRHIAGQRVSDFVSNAVWQHRIAQMEPEARDDIWIYYRDHRPIVHGTDKYTDDWPAMKALLRSAGFTWSGYAKAYVTAGTTRNISRAQSVDRLARALYEQGRMVEIRADENRLRGVLAPAAPPPSAAPVAPAPQAPALTPQDLTTEQLTAELARLDEERRSAAYGSPRHAQIDKQVALLKVERDERQVVQLADRPDPAGMDDAEIAAEREELQPALRTRMYTNTYADDTPLGAARRERHELLRAEHGRRTGAELEARTPINQMKDEDLQAEGAQLAKDRHERPREAADAMDSRVSAVGKELADRRLQVWGEAPPVDGYDDIELSEELEAVRGTRLSEVEFAGSFPAKERVQKAIDARRAALQEEIKKRDEKAFTTLLETDGRIRLETSSYTSDSSTRVKIDNRWYGSFTDFYPGWRARLWRGEEITHDELWRTDALRWLIEEYEKDPKTRDTRTWGPYVDIELLPAFAEQLTAHQYNGLSPSGAVEKYLIEEIADSSRSQTFDAYGKKRMMHILDLPERTLPVLEQMGRRLLALIDEELDSDDRKVRAKAKSVRPKVLATLDDLVSLLGTHGLEPLTADNTNTGTSQDGETDGERVREDGPSALGNLPAPGAGTDGGPGDVLPGSGEGRTAADRGADPGEDGRSDAGDGPPAAGGQAESGPADGPGAGAEGDRVPAAGGGEPGRGAALEVTSLRILTEDEAVEEAARAFPVRFRPTSQEDLAPAGERAKAAANLEAVRVLKRVREEAPRAATVAEQQILARWSGWGSVPEVFAARPREDDPAFGPGGERDGGYAAAAARWEALADVRDPLRTLLDDDEWSAAAASTLSAHYTPPEITSALWEALTDLGFDGGDVLEPGSGAGVSFGTAPDTARLTGVEIDPTSAAISRLLAPRVTVLNESFADTVAPDGAFDATVGNVPFARVALFDPKHNKGRHRIHNHFLVKSVALTRPGGIVALITSRHTLDALLAAARQDLLGDADLLGAVRLPNKAFARSAGTDVVTDILILRRRAEGEGTFDPGTEGYQGSDWVKSVQHEIGEHTLPVNSYFIAHPEHVLGTLTTRMGARGPEVAVDGDPDVTIALRTALRQITDRAVLARRGYTPHPEGPHRPHLRLKPAADLQDFTGRLSADVDGKLWQASSDGEQTAIELPADQHAQLAALIELKDLVRGLNELDRSGTDRALADAHRRLTKQTYERYVAAHGPLSRPRQQQHATTTTDAGDVTGLTGWGYFLNDPQAYEVLALEMWEAGTETVHVSEVLDHAPAARRSLLGQHTDDPQLALDTVVAERGHVDLPHIAWMLQVDEDEARRRLGRSVFNDPLTPELHYSADYLSGDVRTKLQIARQAARRDPAFQVNVAELERVLPREMLPGQFAISLGAAWLPDDLVQEFFRKYLGDAYLTIQHSGNGNWHILKGRGLSEEDEVKHTAGGLAPLALLNRVLNGGAMTGRPSDDEEAARAVRVKAEEWRDAFEAWVLDDSARAARTADVYNRQMNNRVVRDFTGSRPSLAGLDPDFNPYDHQLAAAARMAHERCLVLSHVVGAGKTGALTIGMMAMRNSGQIDKPMVAVPNYLVEQWEGEVRRLYPTARILTLTSADLADGKRDRMLQYVRANTFDMIIVSHSLFDSLPLSPDFYEFYNNTELQKLDAQILHERRREGKSISLKQLQERRQQYEEELKAKAAAYRVPGQVYIDDLGVDFFAIDEAHEYKNLAVRSKIPGARVSGSAKAQHLHAVLEWARMNKPTGPMGCLATGTPLSNAIGELHSLLLLANPDLLRALGIEEFDAFASMYGRLVERLEMTVDGKGFKSVERFASFHSVNSLLRQLWLPAVDYKDEEDLGLVLPSLAGGQPELMLVPTTADQEQRMKELGERYEAFHKGGVDKSIDNPLSINNDARVIALDPRLIDPEAEPGNKLRVLADRVAAEYHETKNNRYTYSTEDLRPHPVPGALQMVFLNHGTPGGNNRGNFHAYQEFKDLLIARDVPADKIDFIHDASRADQRRKLVARANHGGCNVLIGSTVRMGKGLNAQNRCTALYHADPDFRPADMKQKDGRARRKGNQNEVVKIVWVATEKTFDSRMYGILATKAKGFDQLYKARLDAGTDEIQEVDEALVPYEEAMAIISGNVYLIAQEELRKQVRTLTLDQNNRATQRAIVHQRVERLNKEISSLARDINQRGAVLPSLRPALGDDFRITLSGLEYTKHKDAAAPLTDALAGVMQALPERRAFNPETTLGQLGGRDLVAVAFRDDRGEPFLRVHLDGLPGSLSRFDAAELAILKGETLLRRLTKTITDAPERQIEDQGNRRAKQESRDKLLVQGEQLRGQVPGLARVRERLSLIDALVVAQIAVNKAGEPAKDESVTAVEQRAKALARRDELQQQLDTFDATPPPEESSEAGEALLDLDDLRPRDPASLSADARESEAAILRAHITVHGDPDGRATDRLAELEVPEIAGALTEWMDGFVTAAPREAAGPSQDRPDEAASTPSPDPETDDATAASSAHADEAGPDDSAVSTPVDVSRAEGEPTPVPEEQPEATGTVALAPTSAPQPTAPAPPADTFSASDEDLYDRVPGIVAGPGVVEPGMHVEYLPGFTPGSRTRHPHGGEIVSVGPTNVRWRPYNWHQDVRTPLEHMRIDAGAHLNLQEDARRFKAARDAGQPVRQTPDWCTWSLAEHLAYAGRITEQPPGPLVIIPCGSAKLDHVAPAGELYVGSYHRSCRAAADALTADGGTVLILSALYGLVTLDQEIEPYDLRMGQLGSVAVEKLREQAQELGVDGAQEVVILAGETYTDAALQVWPNASTPLAGLGGMGYHLQHLARLAADPSAPVPPQPPHERPQEETTESPGTGSPLQELIDGFGDRVVIGHIGGPPKAATPPKEPAQPLTEQPAPTDETTSEASGEPAPESTDRTNGGLDEQNSGADGDGFGTADLFETFDLPQPPRVPAPPPEVPSETEPEEETSSAPVDQEEVLFQEPTAEGVPGAEGQPRSTVDVEDLNAAAVLRHYEPLLAVVGLSGADAAAYLSGEAAAEPGSDTPFDRLMDDIGRRADRVGGISQQGRAVTMRDVSEDRYALHRHLTDLAIGATDVRQGREEPFGIDLASILADPDSRLSLPDTPHWRLAAAVPTGQVVVAHDPETGYAVYNTFRRRKAGEVLRAQRFRWDPDTVPEGVWRPRTGQSEDEQREAVRALLDALAEAAIAHATHGQMPGQPAEQRQDASPTPSPAETAAVASGQPTEGEAQPEDVAARPDPSASRSDGRERLVSADGRLTFTLLVVPEDDGVHQQAVEGYQRRRAEIAAVVEAKDTQAAQTPEERAERLAEWRRSYPGVHGREPFRPYASPRLIKGTQSRGFAPQPFAVGSSLTWRDEQSGQQVTGQVMSPGAAHDTWYVSTDRTGHTGEYHVLTRSGKKKSGYHYSINGAAVDVQPAQGLGAQVPFEDLPGVDSIPARPVTSYADYVPGGIWAPVREPIPVTVGKAGVDLELGEVAIAVTADGIPFSVILNRNDDTGTETFQSCVVIDGEVRRALRPVETRGEAVDACVRMARAARENFDKLLRGRGRDHELTLATDGVCGACSLHEGNNATNSLYRVDNGDPQCIDHVESSYGVEKADLHALAQAVQLWALRVAPQQPAENDTVITESPTEETAEQVTAAALDEPHEVDRAALQGGNRITAVVSGRSIEWDGEAWGLPVPETATVTGTVFPGYRDYGQNATLLDAVIVDQTGKQVTAPDRVYLRHLPAQVQFLPAEHRDDLRPETRTVAKVRLGDLIAEGGARGESVTELRYGSNRKGSVMGFSTRDVATGAANGFALDFTDEVQIVPRERRLPQDVAAVFGHHGSDHRVAVETRQTYELHAAVAEVASRVWPDGDTGPQDEIQALSEAIGAIDAAAKGVDAYRANAAAMETADAAAAALFAATDDDLLNGYVGEPLHRLRQHLDVQAQRLHADVAHLAEQAAAAPAAAPSPADESTPPVPEEQGAQKRPVERLPPTPDTTSTVDAPGTAEESSAAVLTGMPRNAGVLFREATERGWEVRAERSWTGRAWARRIVITGLVMVSRGVEETEHVAAWSEDKGGFLSAASSAGFKDVRSAVATQVPVSREAEESGRTVWGRDAAAWVREIDTAVAKITTGLADVRDAYNALDGSGPVGRRAVEIAGAAYREAGDAERRAVDAAEAARAWLAESNGEDARGCAAWRPVIVLAAKRVTDAAETITGAVDRAECEELAAPVIAEAQDRLNAREAAWRERLAAEGRTPTARGYGSLISMLEDSARDWAAWFDGYTDYHGVAHASQGDASLSMVAQYDAWRAEKASRSNGREVAFPSRYTSASNLASDRQDAAAVAFALAVGEHIVAPDDDDVTPVGQATRALLAGIAAVRRNPERFDTAKERKRLAEWVTYPHGDHYRPRAEGFSEHAPGLWEAYATAARTYAGVQHFRDALVWDRKYAAERAEEIKEADDDGLNGLKAAREARRLSGREEEAWAAAVERFTTARMRVHEASVLAAGDVERAEACGERVRESDALAEDVWSAVGFCREAYYDVHRAKRDADHYAKSAEIYREAGQLADYVAECVRMEDAAQRAESGREETLNLYGCAFDDATRAEEARQTACAADVAGQVAAAVEVIAFHQSPGVVGRVVCQCGAVHAGYFPLRSQGLKGEQPSGMADLTDWDIDDALAARGLAASVDRDQWSRGVTVTTEDGTAGFATRIPVTMDRRAAEAYEASRAERQEATQATPVQEVAPEAVDGPEAAEEGAAPIERPAAAPAENTSTSDESAPPVPEEQRAPDQPTKRTREGEDMASQGTGETEQLGLFGDPEQGPSEGPAEPETAPDSGDLGAQLQAALIEGETIAPVSFTDRREPTAGWILTTAAGHTFRLRPVTYSRPDEDHWEAGHDADGSYWWDANLDDWPLRAVLARIREDSATRTRFASLWARYGHLTAQAPQFETTTDRVQLEDGVYLVRRFGSIGLIASCRWGWEHLTDPDGAQGHTGENWSHRGPDNRQYVAEWKIWHSAQEAIPNARLRVVAQLTDDMADTPDAYCDASAPYVGKCSAKRSGARYTVAVDTDQGSELGCYTVCARCLSHRLLNDEDRQIGYRDVQSLVQALAKGDPKVVNLHWKQWLDRIAELGGQMLSAALDAGETAPWPAQALRDQIIAEAYEAGDDRAMREARAKVKAAGGDAKAQKRAAEEAFAARQDRAALVALHGATHMEAANAAGATLGLAGSAVEGSNAAPEPAEEAPGVIDVNTLTVTPQVRNGEPSSYEFTVTGPGLTVGKYEISHDAQGRGARGIMWRATWHGVEPSGRWDVISIGSGEGESAALAAVAEHAAKAGGDLAAGFTVARRMHYDAGLWVLPEVGESEAIQYHPDGSWTITAETGVPYTVRREWRGRTASGDLAPLLIEDQAGTLVASCTAVDSYMSAWAPMLDRLRLHATAVADGVPHATAVTLGGPTQEWVEAWCVCSWTERADVAKYADRTPAGEALALAHHSETSTADAAPQPLAAVVTPTLDDAAQTETAEAPAAAELPELDVVLLDVDVPPLDPAEPYSTDEEAQADIDRLSEAFARWDALPTVQRYYDADRQQRPDGTGDPTNPVAQLAAAYRDAGQSLRDGPAGSPDDLVRQVHTVAVWSGALETVVGEDLRSPLGQVQEAAALLASRSRATIEAFEAELAALAANSAEQSAVDLESAAAETEPTEQEPVDADDEPETPAEPEPGEAATDTSLAEPSADAETTTDAETDSATDDDPAPDPQEAPEPPADVVDAQEDSVADAPEPARDATDELPVEQTDQADDTDIQNAARDDVPVVEDTAMTTPPVSESGTAPTDAVTAEDPPEPQRWTDPVSFPADPAFELRLSGFDGQEADSGDVYFRGGVFAEVERADDGMWIGKNRDYALPYDATAPVDNVYDAAVQIAVQYSAVLGHPYGQPPVAAVADGPNALAEVLRTELSETAVWHQQSLASLAERVAREYSTHDPRAVELLTRLNRMAEASSNAYTAPQMTQALSDVEQAADGWRESLSNDFGSAERQLLGYPLAQLMVDVRRLEERLEATGNLARAEQEAARQREAAERAAAEAAPTPPAPSQDAAERPAPGTTAAANAGTPPESAAVEPDDGAPDSQTPEVPDSQSSEAVPEVADEATERPAEESTAAADVATPPESAAVEPDDGAPDSQSPEVPDSQTPEDSRVPAGDEGTEGVPAPAVDGPALEAAAAEPGAGQPAQGEAAPGASPEPYGDVPPWTEWGDMPLWTEPVTSEQTEERPVNVVADFAAVQQAWDETVPADKGTGADLFAEVQEDLRTLRDEMIAAAGLSGSTGAIEARLSLAGHGSTDPSVAKPVQGENGPGAEAEAVNTALRQADAHAPALQDLPEWQRIQTVRGAFGNLMRVIKDRAGEHLAEFLSDHRVGDFLRRISIRACERIAGWAQAGADWLRRGDRRGSETPAAVAMQELGDAATAYTSPAGGRSGRPATPRDTASVVVEVPSLRRLGEALARPLPGAKEGQGARVSTAAARGRSTTRRGTTKSSSPAEQASHLRRGGTDQQSAPKPTKR